MITDEYFSTGSLLFTNPPILLLKYTLSVYAIFPLCVAQIKLSDWEVARTVHTSSILDHTDSLFIYLVCNVNLTFFNSTLLEQ